LSLRDVRDSSGLALSYLHRIERGRVVEPSPSTLRRLAAALDVPYIDLMRVAGYL
jgi:transcriptional regulator with XRE-family HTH domain